MDQTATVDDRLLAVVERLAQARRAHAQRTATKHGLSPLQVDLITALRKPPPPAHRTGSLATEFDVSAPTATDAIAALRRKGFVVESSDPVDARRKSLALTRDGERLADALDRERTDLLAALEGLPSTAKATSLATLLQLLGEFVDRGIVQVDRSCMTCRFHRPARSAAGYCNLLETALTNATLRVDCPEHQPT
jgi:DNA-binding MarR family transcriptional regulator